MADATLDSHDQSPAAAAENPHSSKRQRIEQIATGPRTRANTACSHCRRRKAKCDNRRPHCGFCIRQKVSCVYEDDTVDPPRYDVGTIEILTRLDDVRRLLQQSTVGTPLPAVTSPYMSPDTRHASASNGKLRSSGESVRATSVHGTACESLLQWPVFADSLSEQQKLITSFLLDVSQVQGTEVRNEYATTIHHEVSGKDSVALCEKFLQFVHPRNPILDPDELLKLARDISTNGLDWDGSSCLILILCALAHITTPWKAHNDLSVTRGTLADDKSTAEAYFHAARRRIGLLRDSIVDLQCLFFASIYEKHAMRPLEAFQYIQQLSSRLQIRRRQNSHSPPLPLHERKEARLVFSCLKAQSELQPEIGLDSMMAPCAISSDELPQPPSNPSPTDVTCEEQQLHQGEPFGQQQERGWLFYLSEISLRRRIQETLALLYAGGEAHWLHNIDLVAKQYEECQNQIELWYSHLPATLKFDEHSLPQNELAFYLQGRFFEWRTLLMRPFFYYQLHRHEEHVAQSAAAKLADSYLEHCSAFLQHMACHGRHGGTWFVCRHAFAAGMSVLASVISENRVKSSQHWINDVNLALKVLRTWAPEAVDVAAMADVLDRVYWEVCRRRMVNPIRSGT